MTSVNKLNQVDKIEDKDLIPLWDGSSSRTRSAPASHLKPYLKYVSDLTVNGTTLTVHYSDGTTKDLTI